MTNNGGQGTCFDLLPGEPPALIYSLLGRNNLRYLDRFGPLALLAMRLTLGTIMSVHGYHKVFGDLRHFAHMVGGMGLPAWLGYVSAYTELIGGLLLLVGFLTRPAAFAICINLCVAIWKVHLHNGLLGSPDRPGFEFPLAAATLAFALIFLGAGPISIDHVLRGGVGGSSR
jgi:putative oxidoreductase